MHKIEVLAILFLMMVSGSFLSAANPVEDKLLNELSLAATPKKRINTLNKLVVHYQRTAQVGLSENYNKEAMEASRNENYPLGLARAWYHKGRIHRRRDQLEEAKNCYESAAVIAKEHELNHLLGEIYLGIGFYHSHFMDLDSAEFYFNQTKEIASVIPSKKLKAKAFISIGRSLSLRERYEDALAMIYQGIRLYAEANLSFEEGMAHGILGGNYYKLGDYKKAKTAYMRCIELIKEKNYPLHLGRIYMKLGEVYKEEGAYSEALTYMNESLDLALKHQKHPFNLSIIYFNVAELQRLTWDYEKARLNIEKAIELTQTYRQKSMKILCQISLSKILSQTGYLQEALDICLEAKKMAQEVQTLKHLKEASHALFQIHQQMGHYHLALEEHIHFKTWSDSIVAGNNQTKIQAMFNEYEKKRLQQEMALVQRESTFKELDIKQRNVLLGISGGMVFLLFATSLLLYKQFRSKKQSMYRLESTKDELEMRNQELLTLLDQKKGPVVSVDHYTWVKEKNRRWVKLIIEDIIYVEAKNNNIDIISSNKLYREIGVSLAGFIKQINHQDLIRVHRSYLVNTKHLKMMEDNTLFLSQGKVPVGESYRRLLFDKLHFLRTSVGREKGKN